MNRMITPVPRTPSWRANAAPTRLSRALYWWLLGTVVLLSAQWLTTPTASAQFQTYVPMVASTSGPGGSGGSPEECGLNTQETNVAASLVNHPDQQRATLVCDPILAQVARARARDMALRGYFSHTNPDGEGPNLLVRRAGYSLPSWYSTSRNANNIESIGGGHTSANAVWQGWLNSSAHRTHLLGENDFYASQEAYGIGYYFNPDSPLKHYWVFISAPVAE